MMMIGLSLLIIMILLAVANYMTITTNYQMNVNTAVQAVDTLKVAADFVYIHGHPTKTTVKIRIPPGADAGSTYANGKTINIGLEILYGTNDIYAITKGELHQNSTLPGTEGYYVMVINSTSDGKIMISEKEF